MPAPSGDWSLGPTYQFYDDLFIVVMFNEKGRVLAWLLDENVTFMGHLGGQAEAKTDLLNRAQFLRLHAALGEFLNDVSKPCKETSQLAELAHAGYQSLSNALIVQFAKSYCASIDFIQIPCEYDGSSINNHIVKAAIDIYSSAETARRADLTADGLRISSLKDSRTTTAAVEIPLSTLHWMRVLVSHELGYSAYRIILTHRQIDVAGQSHTRGGFIFIPSRNLFIHDWTDLDAVVSLLGLIIGNLINVISHIDSSLLTKIISPRRHIGYYLHGRTGGRHLGHAIWDELSFLDIALRNQVGHQDIKYTQVFYSRDKGGSDLFCPLQTLFPELQLSPIRVETPAELLSAAIRTDSHPVRPSGRYVSSSMRRRFAHALQTMPETPEMKKLSGPVIALGLRLTNRRPSDLLGFYGRLIDQLSKRFAPLSVIFDGLNIAADQSGIAAKIYNPDANVRTAPSDGLKEVEEELAFVQSITKNSLNNDINIFNCVNSDIMTNLKFLSYAHFFVAPNGAGLAKLRWALDVPGYVLTSQKNLNFCWLYDLYGNKKYMEAPYSNIYYNTIYDVVDVDNEDLSVTEQSFAPWPTNFDFRDEAYIINQISDLLKLHYSEDAADVY